MNMNTKVKNRRGAFTLLKDYVNSMIVSQDLAKNICDMEVNESYVWYIVELNRKLESVKKSDSRKLLY